jgi:DNA-binding transcriptional LysR family regulator
LEFQGQFIFSTPHHSRTHDFLGLSRRVALSLDFDYQIRRTSTFGYRKMRPTFDMDALRTMVVGTELGSFARAASQLGRSQSAISMQLKKLEEQAGKPLFRRSGRGLLPTEAGDALLAYARRIITLNDEAAVSLGATVDFATVRLGLPQDFFEDVMPSAITRYSRERPDVHVEIRAGRNYALEEEVVAGRLDVALAFGMPSTPTQGTRLASLPMLWLAGKLAPPLSHNGALPLVLFDHPCLFRQTGLQVLERKRVKWRLALTTPSLPGIWATIRSTPGLTLRTGHRLPSGIRDIGDEFNLPKLPRIELRIIKANQLSPAAASFCEILEDVIRKFRD